MKKIGSLVLAIATFGYAGDANHCSAEHKKKSSVAPKSKPQHQKMERDGKQKASQQCKLIKQCTAFTQHCCITSAACMVYSCEECFQTAGRQRSNCIECIKHICQHN